MQYAPDAEPAILQPPFCCDCKHYEPAPEGDMTADPQCRKGVRYGTARITAVSVKTMRDDHWWGTAGCQREGRFWEERT